MSVDRELGHLSLDEKVGQMFMLAFAGTRLEDARRLFGEYHVGATYLSNDNFVDPDQAAQLLNRLQSFARLPILTACDQEGAWAVLTPHAAAGPGNMALGAADDPDLARRVYRMFGRELRAVGIFADLAPAVDVQHNPTNPIIGTRSFGERPVRVSALGAAAVEGLHEGGVAATAKHFPGHGDTTLDTHRDLPAVHRSREEITEGDLRPFRAAVDAGVDMVMTAHIIYPALDAEPATLSAPILRRLLRDEMGFRGVVITDSFNMGGFRRHYDPREATVRTVVAGADLIMLAEERYDIPQPHYLEGQVALIDALRDAVRRGEVREDRIDESVRRILELKARYGLLQHRPIDPERAAEMVGTREHRALEEEAAGAALVLVRGALPLTPRPQETLAVVHVVDPENTRRMEIGRGIGPNVAAWPFPVFAAEVQRRHTATRVLEVDVRRDLDAQLDVVRDAPTVIVMTEKYPLAGFDFDTANQVQVVRRLMARGHRVAVAGLCPPYELAEFPTVDIYLACFGFRPASARAAARALFGEARPHGVLPVTIPGVAAAGTGSR